MKNETAINYYEIPVTNMERAKNFYETILDIKLKIILHGESEFAIFPQKNIGGSLAKADGYQPSMTGTLCYLNAGENLSIALGKVENAGGKITSPKSPVGDHGFVARFSDTEGNLIALHSTN